MLSLKKGGHNSIKTLGIETIFPLATIPRYLGRLPDPNSWHTFGLANFGNPISVGLGTYRAILFKFLEMQK